MSSNDGNSDQGEVDEQETEQQVVDESVDQAGESTAESEGSGDTDPSGESGFDDPDKRAEVLDPDEVDEVDEERSIVEVDDPEGSGKKVVAVTADLTEEEKEQLNDKADEIMNEIVHSDAEHSARQRAAEIGKEQQAGSRERFELLEKRLSDQMDRIKSDEEGIPKSLSELRETMSALNPNSVGQQEEGVKGYLYQTLDAVPFLGDWATDAMEEIAERYDSVQDQIDDIIDQLEDGKERLKNDVAELEQLYQQVENQQGEVQQQIYVGEQLAQRLKDKIDEAEDETERKKFEQALHRVQRRVEDLRAIEQANMQYIVSLDTTMENNVRLMETVDRTVDVTKSLLDTGLSIQVALDRQKRTMEQVNATQEYTSRLLEQNSEQIRESTEIVEMQNESVLDIDRMENAFRNLESAMNEMEEARSRGLETAEQNIKRLSSMSSELQDKIEQYEAGSTLPDDFSQDEEPDSLESDTQTEEEE